MNMYLEIKLSCRHEYMDLNFVRFVLSVEITDIMQIRKYYSAKIWGGTPRLMAAYIEYKA